MAKVTITIEDKPTGGVKFTLESDVDISATAPTLAQKVGATCIVALNKRYEGSEPVIGESYREALKQVKPNPFKGRVALNHLHRVLNQSNVRHAASTTFGREFVEEVLAEAAKIIDNDMDTAEVSQLAAVLTCDLMNDAACMITGALPDEVIVARLYHNAVLLGQAVGADLPETAKQVREHLATFGIDVANAQRGRL